MSDWRDRAACRGMDTAIFYPENGDYTEAKKICATCPVQLECLTDARSGPHGRHGMWGGFTEDQRNSRSIRRFNPRDRATRDEMYATWTTLYNQKLGDAAIAERTGVDRSTVTGWRIRNGMPTHHPKAHGIAFDAEVTARRVALANQGYSAKELAFAECITLKAAHKWMARAKRAGLIGQVTA